jgi:hypothetical protein
LQDLHERHVHDRRRLDGRHEEHLVDAEGDARGDGPPQARPARADTTDAQAPERQDTQERSTDPHSPERQDRTGDRGSGDQDGATAEQHDADAEHQQRPVVESGGDPPTRRTHSVHGPDSGQARADVGS